MTQFHHGVIAQEPVSGILPMQDAAANIIGLIAHASDADPAVFPLDTPVLVTSISRALASAGYDGTLRRSLETIALISTPLIVVVRVDAPAAGENGGLDMSSIIGSEAAPRTGLHALLNAKSRLGIVPKILIAPELETPDVVQAMSSLAQRMRAFCYATPRDTAAVMLPDTPDVVTYRDTLASRELMLLWPEFTGGNVLLAPPTPAAQHFYALMSAGGDPYHDLNIGEGEGIRVSVNDIDVSVYDSSNNHDPVQILTNALTQSGLTVSHSVNGSVHHWSISSATPRTVTITGLNASGDPASNVTIRAGLGETPATYATDILDPATFTLGAGSDATYGPGVLNAVTVAAALRAKIDQNTGWHKSISNVPVTGPTGISAEVYWDLEDPDTDAGYLNSHEVTTLIQHQGFRFWGNRTTSSDQRFAFEVYTRTAQFLLDTIINGVFGYIDQPLTIMLARDIIDSINAKLRAEVKAGHLIGASVWYDPNGEGNSVQDLQQGRFWIDYDYTPVPPLEQLGLRQRITSRYLVDFAQLATGNTGA